MPRSELAHFERIHDPRTPTAELSCPTGADHARHGDVGGGSRHRAVRLRPAGHRGRARWRVVLGLAAVFLLVAGGIVGEALQTPGNDPVPAKLAEWGRDHGLNP